MSAAHRDAVEVMLTLRAATKDIGEHLSQQHALAKTRNRETFYHILRSVKYLSRQGLALRGHGDDTDGNLTQLLKMKAETDHHLAAWLERKDNTCMSPTFQNEILKVMGLNLLRKLAAEFHKSSFVTVMADKTRDASNTEQLV